NQRSRAIRGDSASGYTGTYWARKATVSAGTLSNSKVTTSALSASRRSCSRSSYSARRCSPSAAAQASAAGSRKANCCPSGVPASASMRPSCPPPMMPIFMLTSSRLSWIRVVQYGFGLVAAVAQQRLVELRVAAAQNTGSQQRGVDRAGLADGQRRDRHAGGHLHDGQQRVNARQHG